MWRKGDFFGCFERFDGLLGGFTDFFFRFSLGFRIQRQHRLAATNFETLESKLNTSASSIPKATTIHPSLISGAIAQADWKLPIARSLKKKKFHTGTELQALYKESRIQFGKAQLKGIKQDDKNIGVILKIFGIENLEEMDVENAELIRDILPYWPKNISKYREFDGLTPLQVVQLNRTLNYPTLSAGTIKGMIQKFSSFCAWAVNHGHLTTNHFYKLPTRQPRPEDARQAFNDKQLTSIFNMSDYSNWKFLHNYYYWIPLLLRLTGARLNELCQLFKDDIKLIDDIWCLIIREQFEGQRVKNLSSARVIPIHPALIERGFLEFVRTLSTKRIFAELKEVNGYYSNNASKWFARRREKLGFGKGLDAHSFRHTFADELKGKGAPKEKIEELLGHSHNSLSMDLYGKRYRPSQLMEVITLIDDSHLAHIRPFPMS
ncbi:site-specific integrase [Vibrio breoganii]|uniref:site-specific integrase n=1 Tax=Vibrio breoganii TaxID=553239 RepID=UPI00031B3156|nr:site-specific integrase [Vibrio breoganii]OEF85690.1 hypothetical protein B003_05825 [Vibrio breoganii 1C10]